MINEMAKNRNPIAQILKYFKHKRFKDKTKYIRKRKHKKESPNNEIYFSTNCVLISTRASYELLSPYGIPYSI